MRALSSRLVRLLPLLAALGFAGCFAPDHPKCSFRCTANNSFNCPTNYTCDRGEGFCKRTGVTESCMFGSPDLAPRGDTGAVDAMAADARPDQSVDQAPDQAPDQAIDQARSDAAGEMMVADMAMAPDLSPTIDLLPKLDPDLVVAPDLTAAPDLARVD